MIRYPNRVGGTKAFKAESERNLASHKSRQTQHARRDEMAREIMSQWNTARQGSRRHLRSLHPPRFLNRCEQQMEYNKLGCFVVMPNHVHAIAKAVAAKNGSKKILQLEGFRKKDQQVLGRSGVLWQRRA